MAANTDKLRKKKSIFSTTLNGGIDDSAATIALSSTSGLATDTAITLTIDRVDANGVSTPTKVERVTGVVSGSNLTSCLRGQDGTTAQVHSSGAVVEDIWDADTWNDAVDAVLAEHSQAGAHTVDTISEKTAATGVTIDGLLIKDAQAQKPAGPWTTATDGTTVTFDLAVSRLQIVTLGGNRTLALSNAATGMVFCIFLKQDATGSRTVTWWSGITWAGGSAPTLTTTASKADAFVFVCYGSNTYYGFVAGQNI
jgi:hypothetical protein